MSGDPEFWASVVGLAAAFIVAAALETSPRGQADPVETWVLLAGLAAVLMPTIMALLALAAIADHKDAPSSSWVLTFGAPLLLLEVAALQVVRIGGRTVDNDADSADA